MASNNVQKVKHIPATTSALAQVVRARVSEAIGLRNSGQYKEMEEALMRAEKAMHQFVYAMTKKEEQ